MRGAFVRDTALCYVPTPALEASQPLSPAPSTVSPRTAKAVASAALHVQPAASSSASARTPTSPRASQEYKASPMIMMGAGLESPRDRALLGGTSSHEPRPSVGGRARINTAPCANPPTHNFADASHLAYCPVPVPVPVPVPPHSWQA